MQEPCRHSNMPGSVVTCNLLTSSVTVISFVVLYKHAPGSTIALPLLCKCKLRNSAWCFTNNTFTDTCCFAIMLQSWWVTRTSVKSRGSRCWQQEASWLWRHYLVCWHTWLGSIGQPDIIVVAHLIQPMVMNDSGNRISSAFNLGISF
jgi:hypothetical protein